jgi:hypothetical protein
MSASGGLQSSDTLILDSRLDGPGSLCRYALYELADVAELRTLTLDLRTSVTEGQGYAGLANYSWGQWEWHAIPADGLLSIELLDGRPYVSPAGSFNFCVASPQGSRVVVRETTLRPWFDVTAETWPLRCLWDPVRLKAVVESDLPDIVQLRDTVRWAADGYLSRPIVKPEWTDDTINAPMALAVAWRVTGETIYRDRLTAWLNHIATLPDFWIGKPESVDLDAGMLLAYTSICLAWNGSNLDPDVQESLRELIAADAEVQSDLLSTRPGRYFWNHTHYQALGIYAAGCILEGYDPRAAGWRAQGAGYFEQMEVLLDEAGEAAYPEGVAYSTTVYFLAALYRQLRQSFELSCPDHSWWSKTGQFYAQTTRPDGQGSIMIGDDYGPWIYHPSAILRYAASYLQDSALQAQAIEMYETSGKLKDSYDWLAWQILVLADPGLAPLPAVQPTTCLMQDWGLYVHRTGWDSEAGLLACRSGLPGGAVYNAFLAENPEYRYGSLGHLHPDLQSLQWWCGDTCLLSDPGFEAPKLTSQHNAVTFSGRGQMGEAAEWWGWGWDWKPWGYGGSITSTSQPTADVTVVDMQASDAYVPITAVKAHLRRVIWIRPNLLLVQDSVELDQERTLETHWITQLGQWHTGSSASGIASSGRLRLATLGAVPDTWVRKGVDVAPTVHVERITTNFTAQAGKTHTAHLIWDLGQPGWRLTQRTDTLATFILNGDSSAPLTLSATGDSIAITGPLLYISTLD